MLVLDGVFQTSIKDEFMYHESIVHIPMFLHPNPKKVLIIGGGDGGAAREAVRHPEVESVTMVDIDGKVIELSKQYFPEIAKAMIEGDPKLTVKVGDGIAFMREAENYYDVIIVDCSDPVGPGEGLFSYDFYKDTFRALKDDGLFVQQTAVHAPQAGQGYLRLRVGHLPHHPPVHGLHPPLSVGHALLHHGLEEIRSPYVAAEP